jgi:hypothetical protein
MLSTPAKLMPALAALILFAMPVAAQVQEHLSRTEEQYQFERDPVRKAKLLAKLGAVKVQRAHDYLLADDEEHALSTLQLYRDEVRKTTFALDAMGVNVRKHPGGFKELQITLRQSIRLLDDQIFSLPVDDRPRFEAVRSDLSVMQTALFEALFPTAAEKDGKRR